MNCEQAEALVLDLNLDAVSDPQQRAAAVAHLSHCPRCAALQESWQVAREELRLLGKETVEARTPARVEMRLRQEFRTRHRTVAIRRAAVAAAWFLASAAVLVGGITSWNWLQAHRLDAAKHSPVPANTLSATGTSSQSLPAETLSADDSSDFTPLPGTTLDDTEDSSIFHVRMQRGSLGALGLPVNEARASEWIQVDLLVGNDGLPQAVRLAQEEN